MSRVGRVGGGSGWLLVALPAAFLLVACSDDSTEPGPVVPDPPDPTACEPGETAHPDGSCCPAGTVVNEAGGCCAAGTTALDDGSCQEPGIAPELCGEGFEANDSRGCDAILPAQPCGAGTMAVPGETDCREIAACGTAPWGDIPVEGNTQYVDGAFAGVSDGTASAPWTTIQAGVDAAAAGAIVAVAEGSFVEDVTLENKAVTLWGRCPTLVEVAGSVDGYAAVFVTTGADQSEVRGIATTGQQRGILVSGATDVVIDQVWVHDAALRGLVVSNTLGPTGVAVTGSLFEDNDDLGVLITGSEGSIETSVVRGTTSNAEGTAGRGITLQESHTTGDRANATIRRSLIEGNQEGGVFVVDSNATVEDTVVRDTRPNGQGEAGWGMAIQESEAEAERTTVTVSTSVFEGNQGTGIRIVAADATIESTVVRDTLADAAEDISSGLASLWEPTTGVRASAVVRGSVFERNDGIGVTLSASELVLEASIIRDAPAGDGSAIGRGINVQEDDDTGTRATLTVQGTVIDAARDTGVCTFGSDVTIEATLVRGTLPDAQGLFGRGVSFQSGVLGQPTVGSLRGSLLVGNSEVGLLVHDSDATVEGTAVRATVATGQGSFGRGMQLQRTPGTGHPTHVDLRRCAIEQNVEAAVIVAGAEAVIEASALLESSSNQDGGFGDGLVVIGDPEAAASVQLLGCLLQGHERAGVANFGAMVALEQSVFDCSVIDLNGETDFALSGTPVSIPYDFDNRGGNVCGCGEQTTECAVRSSGLAPPPPMGAAE